MAELHTEITASNQNMVAVLNDTKRQTEAFAKQTQAQLLLTGPQMASGSTNYKAWEDLNSGGAKGASSAKDSFASANKEASAFKTTIGTLGKLSIGAILGSALVALPHAIGDARENLERLANDSRKLNATPQGLQLLQYLSSLADVNFTSTERSLARLNALVGKANSGNKSAIGLFASIGIDAKDLQNSKADEIYLKVGAGILKLNEAAAQSSKSNDFFGAKNGVEQLSILRNDLEKTRAAFAGKPLITENDIANFDQLDSKSKNLFASISANGTKAFALLTPTILGALTALDYVGGKLTQVLSTIQKLSFTESDLIDKVAALATGNNYDPAGTVTAADVNTFRRAPGASVVPNYLTNSDKQVVTIKIEADKNGLITALASSSSAKIIINSAVEAVAAAAAAATGLQ